MRSNPISSFFLSVALRLQSAHHWVARKQLESEWMQYASVERTLTRQIANDTEALAYAQIQQAIALTRLQRLAK